MVFAQVEGLEPPTTQVWKLPFLPLNYTCMNLLYC